MATGTKNVVSLRSYDDNVKSTKLSVTSSEFKMSVLKSQMANVATSQNQTNNIMAYGDVQRPHVIRHNIFQIDVDKAGYTAIQSRTVGQEQ